MRRALRTRFAEVVPPQIARDGATAVTVKVGGAILSLVMMMAIARTMSADDFGRFVLGYSLALFAAVVAGLGLPTGILRWRPEHEVQGAPELALRAERWASNATLAAATLTGGALAAAGWAAGRLGLGGDAATLAAAGVLTAPLAASSFAAGALRARGATLAALAPRDLVWRGATAACAGATAAADARLTPAEALLLAAGLLAAATGAQWAATGARPGRPPGGRTGGPAGRAATRAWRRQALPMWLATLVAAGQRHAEVMLAGLFLAPSTTGLYFAALTAAQSVTLIQLAGNMAVGPLAARAWHAGDVEGLQRLLRAMMAAVVPPTLAATVLVWAFADAILELFSPDFAGRGPLLALLAGGAALTTLSGPAGLLLMLASGERAQLRLASRVVGATIAAQAAALPVAGVWGAAVVNVAGAATLSLCTRAACRRLIGVEPTALCLLRRGAASAPAGGRASLLNVDSGALMTYLRTRRSGRHPRSVRK